jgi:Flp pilus assembly protein TadD
MTELLRLWNLLGGDLPGGIAWLPPALAGWALLLYKVIRPIGVFRDRRPTFWLWGGWLLLVGLHVLLRARATTPAGPPTLLLWPPDSPVEAEAVWARAEWDLADSELEWNDRPLELRPLRHLLAPGRRVVADRSVADSLLAALDVAFLVDVEPGGSAIRLWRRAWRVCDQEDREALAGPGPEALHHGLQRLLERNFQGVPRLDGVWRAAWLPLYGAVVDSAARWLELPAGPLPMREDLRRSELTRALGGPVDSVVAGLNRGLGSPAAASHADPWLTAGFWFADQGEWDQVAQALTNALAVDPGHPLIYWQLAHLAPARLEAFGFPERRLARLRCLGLYPAFLPALFEQVPDWLARRQGARAMLALERALVAYPDHGELWLLRGNTAYELLDAGAAQLAYRRAQALLPGDARPWLNLGQLHVVHGELDKAVPELERAVELGSPPLALHLLGLAHAKLGRVELARRCFLRRLELGGPESELAVTRRQLAALDEGVR